MTEDGGINVALSKAQSVFPETELLEPIRNLLHRRPQNGFILAGKDTQTVVNALIKQAKKLPKELYNSLTWDRGKELTDHRRFSMATNIDVYFCDPQSPWQRGSEREYQWPAETVLSKGHRLVGAFASPSEQVARQLNERPRETLQFETPAERFNACVASTG
jgi:IS30 family transposase